MNQPKTRGLQSHSIFGSPLQELPLSELPTRLAVARHFVFLKESKFKSNTETVPKLAHSIINLWIRAGIPPQSEKTVKTKLTRLMEEGSQACKRGKDSEKSTKFLESLCRLFDIAACQCHDLEKCSCDKALKIPHRERQFLIDQRSTRKMAIGGVDKVVSAKMKRSQDRRNRLKEREEKAEERKCQSKSNHEQETTSIAGEGTLAKSESDNTDDSKEEWRGDCSDEGGLTPKERNMTLIPTVARECDRYGVSSRAAAAICTATLIDFGLVDSDDQSCIVDQHKVWRARQKLRKDLREEGNKEDHKISGLFFDGRKDRTRVKEEISGKWYGKEELEDHYVLVGEPGTSYLQHITVQRGTGAAIAEGIQKLLEETGIVEGIDAVGSDSTAVNTGRRNGAIRLLECGIGRPLQWLICYLHLNELPFRHLCQALIGSTESPTQWKGPIGKALSTCETLPLPSSGFKRINHGSPLPVIDLAEMSRDQAYLYKIIGAIRVGNIEKDLLREKPGPMTMARWVTTASRICRLYVATVEPSKNLYTLAKFVTCHYGPMWFQIKCHPKCTDGSNHLLQQIKLTALLTTTEKQIVWPIIVRNAYWAHHENVLLAMLGDKERGNREAAISAIKSIRKRQKRDPTAAQNVREFAPPKIKETAQSLGDLLPLLKNCTSEPPLTIRMSTKEFENLAEEPLCEFPVIRKEWKDA